MASSMLRVIELDGKSIIVEVDPSVAPTIGGKNSISLPDGAEPTGFGDRLSNASQLMENTVASVVATVKKSLASAGLNEISVEIALNFKGEHNPIPVLVKIGSEASIKVTAKWSGKP